ncbi:hypothetical protein DFH29DRAFT_897164 [Suillus ampliporus]|nr:hypothetical protein DFH29DRAFT_897164 [Suillus ampliporus]
MHVCLLPTEILRDIFSIDADCSQVSRLATLAALARTCRTFKEPALDILWEDIAGFQPLISCLPGGISGRDTQGKLTLKRPILNGEWRIIRQYAQRIRSFMVLPTELEIIDDRVVQALISAPEPLLPNLRTLVWRNNQECFLPLLHTLLRPTITSMRLNLSSPPSFAKSTLVASLGARCPFIRELECEYGGDSEESSDAICEALCGLQKLVRLETGVLNTQVLLHLASLPSLKSLHFNLRTYNINETQHHFTPTFSSQLDYMRFITPSPSVLAHCLSNVCFLSCRLVMVWVDCNDFGFPYDPLDIPDLIVSFSECFSPALETLQFDFDFDFNVVLEGEILVNPSFALGFDVIAPLLSFSHLRDLDLDWMCSSAIDDASLKIMAQCWPQLHTLRFGSAVRWLVPPSITFIGLLHLIHHCRCLRMIEMPFCAYPLDTSSEHFSKTIPNDKITCLFTGISPIVEPVAVACQLHTMLPQLTGVSGFDWPGDQIPAPFEHFEDGWRKVNEFLGVLTTGAKMREKLSQVPQESVLPA